MKLLSKLNNRKKPSGRTAFVYWDREGIHYLVAAANSTRLRAGAIGRLSFAEGDDPLQVLSNYLKGQSIAVKGIVVLLSRPDVDVLPLSLPPATDSELPILVANEVEQQVGDSDAAPLIDFCPLHPAETDEGETGNHVLAFSLSQPVFKRIEQQVESAGFRLQSLASRQLASLSVLRRQGRAAETYSVAVHFYHGEAELTVCHHAEPVYLRSIRISNEEKPRIAEQLWMEAQRCLTLVSEESESPTIAWRLFACGGLSEEIGQLLQEKGEASVEIIDPLVGWQTEGSSQAASVDAAAANPSYHSAALAGAAWDYFHGVMPIDLLHPKKAPPPPNPLIRKLVFGSGIAAAVIVAGYVMWTDIAAMQEEVARLEGEAANAKKLTAKVQERADQVNAVESWLADQVDWLAELGDLSARFPDGETATVRRLTAAVGKEGATIDLSVQVAKQEDIASLEDRLRTARHHATSQRINQSSDSEEYPWQFETKVTFPIEPLDPGAYVSPAATKSPSDEEVQQ
jgi:hypothetical protein